MSTMRCTLTTRAMHVPRPMIALRTLRRSSHSRNGSREQIALCVCVSRSRAPSLIHGLDRFGTLIPFGPISKHGQVAPSARRFLMPTKILAECIFLSCGGADLTPRSFLSRTAGSFGTVCTAQHRVTGKVVAVKRIPR